MKIAGLDVGTTGCKCTVFDEKGQYLDKSYKAYPSKRQAGAHEIDAVDVRESVLFVISEMAHKYPDIAGLGVATFGETVILTDEKGEPLHKAMLYTDPRGHEECQELIQKLGEDHIAEITGLRPHEMYGIAKIMWIRNHQPEVYNATKHIFQVEDFIVYTLTGVAQIDYSMATRSLVFDIETLDWNDEILAAAGVERSLYPKPVPTGSVAGKVKPEIAERTGLSTDTVIVSISQDQVAAAVGAGAFDSNVAVDGAGTVECLTPIYDSKPKISEMAKNYFAVVPYIVPGHYVAYAFSYTGGALTQWCTETTAKKEADEAHARGISVYELLEEQYRAKMQSMGLPEDEPTGMLVLPHFAGAATPYMDTGSKGAILGLTTDTSAAELYYACLEGVCYEMYLNYSRLSGTGIRFDRLHATGGGAHSRVWMQMKADVLNLPIVALKTVDAGTVGSAMLTGIAIGLFKDLKEAASLMIEETVTYRPRAEQHEKYMRIFKRYEQLYNAVRPLMQP